MESTDYIKINIYELIMPLIWFGSWRKKYLWKLINYIYIIKKLIFIIICNVFANRVEACPDGDVLVSIPKRISRGGWVWRDHSKTCKEDTGQLTCTIFESEEETSLALFIYLFISFGGKKKKIKNKDVLGNLYINY